MSEKRDTPASGSEKWTGLGRHAPVKIGYWENIL